MTCLATHKTYDEMPVSTGNASWFGAGRVVVWTLIDQPSGY